MAKSDPQIIDPTVAPPFRWAEWLWHPWYAKAWLVAAAAFYLIVLFGQSFIPRLPGLMFVALAFQPAVPVSYVIARSIWSRSAGKPGSWIEDEIDGDSLDEFAQDEDRPSRLPGVNFADPADPLSPLNPVRRMRRHY